MSDLKNNFFEYVNKDWLEKTEIPSDRVEISAFSEIALRNEELFRKLLNDWKNDIDIPNDSDIKKLIEFYRQASDFKMREELGILPAMKYVKTVEDIKDFEDLKNKFLKLELNNFDLPLVFEVETSFKDSQKQVAKK